MLVKRNSVCAIVLHGGVRDIAEIRSLKFPFFARGSLPPRVHRL